MITAKSNGGGNYEIVPAGTHLAKCYQVIHIGTNTENYMGESKEVDKVRIGFELSNELREFKEGDPKKPMVISREFTLSMFKKSNLRAFVEGVIGTSLLDGEADGFDVESLIGMSCLLNVSHKKKANGDGEYAIIQGATPLMKGMSEPEAFNEPIVLNYTDFNQEVFEKLPTFIKEKIQSSKEYQEMKNGQLSDEEKAELANIKKQNTKVEEEYDEIDPASIPF